jgi:hypothetical protein
MCSFSLVQSASQKCIGVGRWGGGGVRELTPSSQLEGRRPSDEFHAWKEISTHDNSHLLESCVRALLQNYPVPEFIFSSVLYYTVKKGSQFGMSLTKLPLAGNNLIIPGQGDFGK